MALVYEPGPVLHLYPADLLRFGATHTSATDETVTAEHHFLCVSAATSDGLWTPLHVTQGLDRIPIPVKGKSGHARWTRGPSFYSRSELWRIPHKAIQRTLAPGGDRSATAVRNRVAATWVPNPSEFPTATT
jgi:hypothetical protein